jgi:hypothetical protein
MDTNLVLRSGDTDLTADETLTSVQIGPMTRPLYLHVLVPTGIVAAKTLDVELEFCLAATSTTEVDNANMKQRAVAGHYTMPFFTLHDYLQVKLNVGGGGEDFKGTKVWIDNSSRYAGAYAT